MAVFALTAPVSAPVRGRFISVPRRSSTSKSFLAPVRASQDDKVEEASSSNSATYFFGGRSYTEEEWQAAKASGVFPEPAPRESFADGSEQQVLGLGDMMAFSGPAPELINGRLAMLAFVAAVGAELSSGDSVLRQLASEPTGVMLTFITFSVATLIPMTRTTEREAFGPFTPNAEVLNGRAAMIGFAALLIAEAIRGGALFA